MKKIIRELATLEPGKVYWLWYEPQAVQEMVIDEISLKLRKFYGITLICVPTYDITKVRFEEKKVEETHQDIIKA